MVGGVFGKIDRGRKDYGKISLFGFDLGWISLVF